MMTTMISRVSTETTRELVLDAAPAPWPPVLWVAMWLVSKVVSLTDIDGVAIVLTVGRMITDRLHANTAAAVDHDVGVGATTFASLHDTEGVAACFGAVATHEVSRERTSSLAAATLDLCTHDPVVLSWCLPRVPTTMCAQSTMVASMVCCEGAELARELVLDTTPSTWEPALRVAMWLVRNVVSLTNVD
jgi:hypothetical protein